MAEVSGVGHKSGISLVFRRLVAPCYDRVDSEPGFGIAAELRPPGGGPSSRSDGRRCPPDAAFKAQGRFPQVHVGSDIQVEWPILSRIVAIPAQQAVPRLIPAQVPGYPPHAGSPRYGRTQEQYYPRYRHGTLPSRANMYNATGPWTNHIQTWPREGGFGPSSPLVTGFFPAMTPPRIALGPLDPPGRL